MLKHACLLELQKQDQKSQKLKSYRKTAAVYAEDFLKHHNSLEGDYVDETWTEAKQEKNKQNEKLGMQIQKLLELTFGEDVEIPPQSLFLLRYIGPSQGYQQLLFI